MNLLFLAKIYISFPICVFHDIILLKKHVCRLSYHELIKGLIKRTCSLYMQLEATDRTHYYTNLDE